jgi:hypothetical protein
MDDEQNVTPEADVPPATPADVIPPEPPAEVPPAPEADVPPATPADEPGAKGGAAPAETPASNDVPVDGSRTGFVDKGQSGGECICPDGRKGTIHSFDAGLVCIPNEDQG